MRELLFKFAVGGRGNSAPARDKYYDDDNLSIFKYNYLYVSEKFVEEPFHDF